jgi:hypothetical protein
MGLKIGGVSIEPRVLRFKVQPLQIRLLLRRANSFGGAEMIAIENQCMGLCELNATLTTSTRGD